jgi:hypothetical protein
MSACISEAGGKVLGSEHGEMLLISG